MCLPDSVRGGISLGRARVCVCVYVCIIVSANYFYRFVLAQRTRGRVACRFVSLRGRRDGSERKKLASLTLTRAPFFPSFRRTNLGNDLFEKK